MNYFWCLRKRLAIVAKLSSMTGISSISAVSNFCRPGDSTTTEVLHRFGATFLARAFSFPPSSFGPPRKKIFLDVACIDQEDPKEKAKGILSLGATLRLGLFVEKTEKIWTFNQVSHIPSVVAG